MASNMNVNVPGGWLIVIVVQTPHFWTKGSAFKDPCAWWNQSSVWSSTSWKQCCSNRGVLPTIGQSMSFAWMCWPKNLRVTTWGMGQKSSYNEPSLERRYIDRTSATWSSNSWHVRGKGCPPLSHIRPIPHRMSLVWLGLAGVLTWAIPGPYPIFSPVRDAGAQRKLFEVGAMAPWPLMFRCIGTAYLSVLLAIRIGCLNDIKQDGCCSELGSL